MSSRKDGGKKVGSKDKESVSKTPSIPLSARALLSRQLGTGTCPGRLPSLRPARDLSLGGSPKLTLGGKTKRTFTPNIPARRVKEEPKDETSRNQSSSSRDKKDKHQGEGHGRGRGRGRGRGGRGRGEIIASQSVFSMGPAEKNKTGHITPSVSFIGGERRDSKTSSKVSVKKENKDLDYGDEDSKKILKMLQTEDDDIEDECSDYGMAPVSIPLANYLQKIKESEDKKDILIKEEPMDVDMEDGGEAKPKLKPKPVKNIPIKTEHQELTCSSLFNTVSELEEEKFLFLQFPDKLPIKSMRKDYNFSSQQENERDTTKEKTNVENNSKLSLKDVSEGYIGKLQVLKSGKTRLVLGDVSLDVAMGTSCSFLQELVAVHIDDDRSDMTVLGQVRHRVICTPDFEKLLLS